MLNFYYKDSITSFLSKSTEEIIGEITLANQFDSTLNQNKSWETQIPLLQEALKDYEGTIFFEFSIPRMGKRVDALTIIEGVVFVIEFKVGETKYHRINIDQVWDYALDLKNFHEPSHRALLAPILVATEAKASFIEIATTTHDDNLLRPIKVNKSYLRLAIRSALDFYGNTQYLDPVAFSKGRYYPTPTIVEAALSLYHNHTVDEITRSDAEAKNLTKTTSVISQLIKEARTEKRKTICFVTGVPGAGKTLVGLKVATSHLDEENGNASVYLSGNGPLVAILQEALARDKVINERAKGIKLSKGKAKTSVKAFIQNIHHYRDAYLVDPKPPYDHVAIFDEAQRAWHKEQTVKFMKQKKGQHDFDYSEPEFLISCLDRHQDWAVIVCLVGGGQEINTGEAGISEWLSAIKNRFYNWEVYISPNLTESEYAASEAISELQKVTEVTLDADLHLAVSMRSFRAENLSNFIKNLLDLNREEAIRTHLKFKENYPIVLTRDLRAAKAWLREKARGSERYGLVVSSQAQRLKPFAIDVKSPMNPVHWFLNDKDDVRSSYYLEDVATEFHVQGLELDWACLTWDGDLRYSKEGWKTFSFVGSKWQHIHKEERKKYLINAYRVLLTRARQGMVIVVPEGNSNDHTRKPEIYDPTFNYLKELGIPVI
ncbi:DUF2075 domain-containing protein [Robiginitalea marina]|uniref:DUF2075 domain-containing protein n=1 Tax=Robiginitalea marina TaxID=2954105 RepID=A0ABT1AVX0_9FLAO|nr:DUF2075 domain-containing protein [Robiginitalea marina]MCO5724157.1 DUF2075 domain-containing protein [Robiginitalea marina]